MERKCVCGASIDVDNSLCSGCRKVYGKVSSEWPTWLRSWMSDYKRELDQENLHHDYALDERMAVDRAFENLQRKAEGDPEFIDVELDEWGNEIEYVDGFPYVDPDVVIACEKRFERRLKALHSGCSRLSTLKPSKLETLRKARLETHLYEERNKY